MKYEYQVVTENYHVPFTEQLNKYGAQGYHLLRHNIVYRNHYPAYYFAVMEREISDE